MKRVLTLAVLADCGKIQSDISEKAEVLIIKPDESVNKFYARCSKDAKGRYVVFTERYESGLFDGVIAAAEKSGADILDFGGGAAFRATVLKGVPQKLIADAFSVNALAALACKTVEKISPLPEVRDVRTVNIETYCAAGYGGTLLAVAEQFGRVKPKLSRAVYSYAFDMLCARLIEFYMLAILDARKNRRNADKLKAFDLKLKDEIVLYLSLNKRFTYAQLPKLRKNGFKISFFTARKLKSALKGNLS